MARFAFSKTSWVRCGEPFCCYIFIEFIKWYYLCEIILIKWIWLYETENELNCIDRACFLISKFQMFFICLISFQKWIDKLYRFIYLIWMKIMKKKIKMFLICESFFGIMERRTKSTMRPTFNLFVLISHSFDVWLRNTFIPHKCTKIQNLFWKYNTTQKRNYTRANSKIRQQCTMEIEHEK